MRRLPRNGSLVGILVVGASHEPGPICTDEFMDRILIIAYIYIQTIKVSRYALRDGEAGGGGNKRRFFARLFLGQRLVVCNCSDALRISDGMAIVGSRRE